MAKDQVGLILKDVYGLSSVSISIRSNLGTNMVKTMKVYMWMILILKLVNWQMIWIIL